MIRSRAQRLLTSAPRHVTGRNRPSAVESPTGPLLAHYRSLRMEGKWPLLAGENPSRGHLPLLVRNFRASPHPLLDSNLFSGGSDTKKGEEAEEEGDDPSAISKEEEEIENEFPLHETIPWIKTMHEDPNFVFVNLQRLQSSGSLMHSTLNTGESVRRYQLYFNSQTNKLHGVFDLGTGLQGHQGVLHGGGMAVLFDEILGGLAMVSMGSVFTAYLTTNFMAPVQLPSVLHVSSEIKSVEGRKCHVTGVMDDGEGKIYSRADALFLTVKGAHSAGVVDYNNEKKHLNRYRKDLGLPPH
eukprot:Nk52_evm14s277 gene=Nk52_evmTU14s277